MKRATTSAARLGLLLLFAIAVIAAVAPSASAAYEIPLATGWNLVSLPEQQPRVALETVTSSIEGKYDAIWTWEADHWLMYDVAWPELSDLDRMDAGRAYWIYMNEPGSLVGAGLKPSSTISIQPGWNFIGYNSSTARSVAAFLGTASSATVAVWMYDSGRWYNYDPQNPGLSDLQTVEPGRGYWVNARASGTLSIDVVVPPTTKVITPTIQPQVGSVNPSQVLFTSPSAFAAALVVGDTVTSGPFALAPNGLLRRVTAVQQTAGGWTVTTVDGTLASAIQTGSVGGTFAGTVDLTSMASRRGITVNQKGRTSTNRRVNVSIGGDFQVDGVTVTVEGEINFQPQFLFNLELDWFRAKEFTCAFTGQLDGSISVQASVGHDFPDKSFTLATLTFSPITIMAGPVPVVFVPEVTLRGTLSGRLEVSLTARVGAHATATVGFGYSQGNGWRLISDAQFAPIWEPPGLDQLNATASVKVSAGPAVSVYLYGLAGPSLSLALFGELDVNAASPHFEVFIGLEHEEKFETSGITAQLLGILGIDVTPDNLSLTPFIKARVYPPSTGFVTGLVTDDGGNPLRGVTATAAGASLSGSLTPELTTTSTDASGKYSLELRPGLYPRIEFAEPGFQLARMFDVVVEADVTKPAPAVKMAPVGTLGDFGGTILNAVNGQPVPDLTILFRRGLNALTGGIVKVATTSAAGMYFASDLEPGSYTGELAGTGYNTGYFTALCLSGMTSGNQDGVISPLLDPSEIRIVLTWGAAPWDLDSHLTGPIEGSATNRFHVFYPFESRGSLTASPWAFLDRDDTDGYGPETATIVKTSPGVYRYSVHDFTNRNSSVSTALANSMAHVSVYRGSSLWKTFDVPSGDGTLWTVFEYSNGIITPVNAMSYNADSGGIQMRAPGSLGEATVTALPRK